MPRLQLKPLNTTPEDFYYVLNKEIFRRRITVWTRNENIVIGPKIWLRFNNGLYDSASLEQGNYTHVNWKSYDGLYLDTIIKKGDERIEALPAISFGVLRIAPDRISVAIECWDTNGVKVEVRRIIEKLFKYYPEAEDWQMVNAAGIVNPLDLVKDQGSHMQIEQSEEINKEWWKNRVTDIGNDRWIIELWRGGLLACEIANKVKRNSSTITKKVCELRKEYGEEIVPYRKRK